MFSVEARATIKHEAVRLSLLSTALIVTLLLLVYRSLPTLLLGLLPVASRRAGRRRRRGAGLRHRARHHARLWRHADRRVGRLFDLPVRPVAPPAARGSGRAARWRGCARCGAPSAWGVLTSICGFASLLPSSFPGLAQLGLFSISGLIAAAAVTRFVLPQLLPQRLHAARPDAVRAGRGAAARAHARLPAWRRRAGAGCALLLLYHASRAALESRSGGAQSGGAQPRRRSMRSCAADLGAPDISNLVVVNADGDQESVLQLAESVGSPARCAGRRAASSPATTARALSAQRARPRPRGSQACRMQRRCARACAPPPPTLPLRPEALRTVRAAGSSRTHRRAARRARIWQAPRSRWRSMRCCGITTAAGTRCCRCAPIAAAAAGAGDIDIGAGARRAWRSLAPGTVLVLNIKQETDALYGSYLRRGRAPVAVRAWAPSCCCCCWRCAAPRAWRASSRRWLLAVLVVSAGFALAGAPPDDPAPDRHAADRRGRIQLRAVLRPARAPIATARRCR